MYHENHPLYLVPFILSRLACSPLRVGAQPWWKCTAKLKGPLVANKVVLVLRAYRSLLVFTLLFGTDKNLFIILSLFHFIHPLYISATCDH